MKLAKIADFQDTAQTLMFHFLPSVLVSGCVESENAIGMVGNLRKNR